jgi:hypothetical protein
MNCSECEQLFDAHLDGQLAGSLRLEFDAHRLRCRRCQQTLAMLEAVGHVIASDRGIPELSGDFADRVMRRVGRPRARILRFPRVRVAVVAGAIVQAAAVLAFAVIWHFRPADSTPPAPPIWSNNQPGDYRQDPNFQETKGLFIDYVDDFIWDAHLAGRQMTTDAFSLAQYLNIPLPADVVRESVKMAGASPLQVLFDSLLPGEEEEPESAPPVDDVHSI